MMSEKTLRALSLVAGYSAVVEDDYSYSACANTADDLCDLGRETMDWIIENSDNNRQQQEICDSDGAPSTAQQIKHEIKLEEEDKFVLIYALFDPPTLIQWPDRC